MKTVALVFLMIFMSLHLGCNRDEGASITRNQGIGGDTFNAGDVDTEGDSNGGYWGQLISTGSGFQDEFQNAVEGLISASNLDHLEGNKPDGIGNVSGIEGSSTGVFMTSADGPARPVLVLADGKRAIFSGITGGQRTTSKLDLSKTSLGLLVRGTKADVEIVFDRAVSGEITNNEIVNVRFEDEYGHIILEGRIVNTTNERLVRGTLKFVNKEGKTYDGRHREGRISFIMDICSFIPCTN